MAAVPLTLLAGYGAGALLAQASRGPTGPNKSAANTRGFKASSIYAAMVLGPFALTAYLLAPDWSLLYTVSSAHFSPLVGGPLVYGLTIAAMLGGYWVGHRLVTDKNEPLAKANVALAGLAFFLVLFLSMERLRVVGHFESYHFGGELVPIAESTLVVALALGLPAAVGAYVYLVLTLPAKRQPAVEPRAAKSAKIATEVKKPSVPADPAGR